MQLGKAFVQGCLGKSYYWGKAKAIGGDPTNLNAIFTDKFNLTILDNADGDEIGAHVCKRRGLCTIRMEPAGYSTDFVIDNTYSPEPLQVVKLTDFVIPELNGYWNYIGDFTMEFSNRGKLILTLPLVRFKNISAWNMFNIYQET